MSFKQGRMKMKGKAKNKRKIGKVILIGMGFFLTIILTFTTTLAWFYDSDWASKYVQMGGSVGIKIKDIGGNFTSGAGNLHFNITTPLAYPGQSVDVSASVYNDGGRSGNPGGSDCYVRAHFAVYTNIGVAPNPDDYITAEYADGTQNPAYQEDLAEYNANQEENEKLSAEALYAFLDTLITSQNANSATTGYYWKYYKRTGALTLSNSGSQTADIKYYLDGTDYATAEAASSLQDKGYFYLCHDENGVMKPLSVGNDATFLWNSTFIIPWQLTNISADKYIFVGLTFQAIQTFIPVINAGVISGAANNQLDANSCIYNNDAVQTVFNSCSFTPIDTKIMIGGTEVNFAGPGFTSCDSPQTP